MTFDDMTFGEMTFGEMTVGEMTFGDLAFGELTFGKMAFGETPGNRFTQQTTRLQTSAVHHTAKQIVKQIIWYITNSLLRANRSAGKY